MNEINKWWILVAVSIWFVCGSVIGWVACLVTHKNPVVRISNTKSVLSVEVDGINYKVPKYLKYP